MATCEQQGSLPEAELSHHSHLKFFGRDVLRFICYNISRHWATTIILVVAVSDCSMHLVRHLINVAGSVIKPVY